MKGVIKVMSADELYLCRNKPTNRDGKYPVSLFGTQRAQLVNDFHRQFEEYGVTPLVSLKCLASRLGIGNLFVKDESFRFGQNSFKVLGSSYAVANIMAQRSESGINENDRRMTFITATDGNHGRGLAWTAKSLGQKCIVYLPQGSAKERVDAITALGAKAIVTECNYDDTVRIASRCAQEPGAVLVQDTAWDGYEDIPIWIMQGYTTMAYEIMSQLAGIKPTHIFLQAGVGSFAAAMTAFFIDLFGRNEKPIITVVEPFKADCLYQSAAAGDGEIRFAKGNLDSIMAGLNCGEPNPVAWDILKNYADFFVAVSDVVTEEGMKILASPVGDDVKISSGETGAVCVGLVAEIMKENGGNSYLKLREELGMDEKSSIMCFSTEGIIF